jgi:membrane protein implicated in regulation of membrane protease activity
MRPSARLIIAIVLGLIAISVVIELLPFVLVLLVAYYIYYRFFKKEEL